MSEFELVSLEVNLLPAEIHLGCFAAADFHSDVALGPLPCSHNLDNSQVVVVEPFLRVFTKKMIKNN